MIEFFKNIVPRVLAYSKDLDEKEIFVEKPWIFIDEKSNHHEYIFMRDGRLVMSLNGIVTIGNWELMPNKKLMINRVADTIMLQKMFVNDALLLLQKSGTSEMPFTLINEKVIPDLDAITYLTNLEVSKIDELPFESSRFKVLIRDDGIAQSTNQVSIFDKVGNANGDVISGIFRTNKKNVQEFIEVKNGEIFNIFFIFNYSYNGKVITIRQKSVYSIQSGDLIQNHKMTDMPVNEKVDLRNELGELISLSINDDGIVYSTHIVSEKIIVFASAILLIAILIATLIAIFYR